MQDRNLRCSRRKFLASAAALTLAGGVAGESGRASLSRTRPGLPPVEGRKPIAVIATVYRALSDAYHLVGRFLHGYPRDGQLHLPRHYVHSLYVDQKPENDLSRDLGREFGFRVCPDIESALVQDGKLAVEGVLLIAEHGNYPRNDYGQVLYPRFEMFRQITDTFAQTGQSVPVYCHKHLSHDGKRALFMTETCRSMGFGLLAGSYLPVTWRRPELDLAPESPLEEGLVAGYGPVEVFGFHALEALQAMMERRTGGETGVAAVTCLVGKDVWRAGDAGRWSWDLLEAALARSETVNPGDIRKNTGSMSVQGMPPIPPTAFLIEYRDGQRGTVLLLNGHVQDFTFAGRLAGQSQPASCLFVTLPPPGARHFDAQAAQIEQLLETGQSPQPVERTLWTTAVMENIMMSHRQRGLRRQTELALAYSPSPQSSFVRGGWVKV
jgi:hypothetical protein